LCPLVNYHSATHKTSGLIDQGVLRLNGPSGVPIGVGRSPTALLYCVNTHLELVGSSAYSISYLSPLVLLA